VRPERLCRGICERRDARRFVQPESYQRGSLAAVTLQPCSALQSCHPCYILQPGEGERTRVGDEHEQSLPAWTDMVGQEQGARAGGPLEPEDPEQGGG
jgi:hypothetical protein